MAGIEWRLPGRTPTGIIAALSTEGHMPPRIAAFLSRARLAIVLIATTIGYYAGRAWALVIRFIADLHILAVAPVQGTVEDKIKARDAAAATLATSGAVGIATMLLDILNNLVSLVGGPAAMFLPPSWSSYLAWAVGLVVGALQLYLRFKQGPPKAPDA